MTDIFPPVVLRVPEGSCGEARVEHFEISEAEARFAALRASLNPGRAGSMPPLPGRYAKLTVGGTLMMTDTRMEQYSSLAFIRAAHGDVLIYGLGLGMVLPALLASERVQSVTVVEKSADVMSLVAPHYENPKLTVIVDDAFSFKPARGVRYDVVFVDIWPDISESNAEEMSSLRRRARRFLRAGGEVFVWMERDVRRMRRSSVRHRREMLAPVGGDPMRKL